MSEPHDAEPGFNAAAFAAKQDWHRAQAQLPLREKFRILLLLQRHEFPLLAARRPLASWERPWRISP